MSCLIDIHPCATDLTFTSHCRVPNPDHPARLNTTAAIVFESNGDIIQSAREVL